MSDLRTIEAFVVDAVKDREVPADIPDCPLSLAARRLILANCPIQLVDISDESDVSLPYTTRTVTDTYDTNSFRIQQPGPNHIRSFALMGPGLKEPWHDEYGNMYSSFTLKGINFTNPTIIEHPVTTDGVVAWGLQESKIISRVLAASDVLVRRGVSTERIIGLAEPKEYPWPIIDSRTDAHEYVSLAEYKQRIVHNYWQELPAASRTVESLADLTRKFSDMTFFISLRVTDTSYRLNDLRNPRLLMRFFDQINRNHLAEGQKSFGMHDLDRHITEVFAPNAGRNLAKLHEDLAHGFANGLNWTALGGIVDTDSVHGESLGMGDTPVTNEERARDMIETLTAIAKMSPIKISDTSDLHPDAKPATINFLRSYFDETIARLGDTKDTVEYLGELVHWFGPAFDDLFEDRGFDDAITEITCSYYFDRFYGTTYADQLGSAHDAVIGDMMNVMNTSEPLAVAIANKIYGQMHIYSETIMSDYIAELTDPEFDAVGQFICDGKRSTAYGYLVQDIAEEIVLFCSQSMIASLPECIKDIENENTKLLITGVYMSHFWPEIKKFADSTASENIPLIENTLRKWCDYERPEPLLPGYHSQPYVGLEAKRFMMSTERVPLEVVMEYIRDFDGELYVAQLPDTSKAGDIKMRISVSDGIAEVISYDGIDGTIMHTTGDKTTMEMSFDADKNEYVMCVSKTPEGKTRLGLLLKDVASLEDARDQIRQEADFVQDGLFELAAISS